ncbi:carbamoyltransferase HypF [Hippea alviniae]|uniref:carbamoyltransferase HypF n=1 Tax=Hippea alviniae TaxID=1279027 RepID=UPI0003B482EB|nr:carbamoyltransferase HypF [Hippea alviniae]
MRAFKILIIGTVQSVGFRPSMYRAFREFYGWVKNSSKGVEIYLEANLTKREIEKLIIDNSPVNASIDSIEIKQAEIKKKAFDRFFIRESTGSEGAAFVPPDLGICNECAMELLDKNNRRFLHPFINCTNCGPRFSIITATPYDREKTTMRHFKMCDECKKEFSNPLDRRFHAQPIACNSCGPEYFLIRDKKIISKNIQAIKRTCTELKNGAVILLKGIGGYHLICDALNKDAIKKLKSIKFRENKPFAVIVKNIETVEKHCFVSEKEKKLLKSQVKPIALLKKKESNFLKDATLNSPYLGVMLPYAPIHILLFYFSNIEFLVATSANLTDKPLIYEDKDALNFKRADYILTNNRRIVRPIEDSIVMVNSNKTLIFRLARGYAPVYLNLKTKPNILAVGADLKNNIAISLQDKIILSQYIGNLEEFENYERFKKNVKDFVNFFNFKPDIVASDKHPDYLSSNYADENFKNVIKIQHHKAHFASVLFENKTEEPAIGVILDGTGFGDDGYIWGGEFFIKDKKIERVGHISYMPFAFGDKAIKEPYRLAMLLLFNLFGEKAFEHRLFDKHKEFAKFIKLAKPTKTSSAGRLFDIVSALIGISETSSYEAEAAINLTYAAMQSDTEERFDYNIKNFEIDFLQTIRQIAFEKRPKPELAKMFHNTFCNAVVQNTLNIAKQTGIKTIALSGGVFQNELVFRTVYNELQKASLKVITNTKVPVNDGGIALGQIYMINRYVNE